MRAWGPPPMTHPRCTGTWRSSSWRRRAWSSSTAAASPAAPSRWVRAALRAQMAHLMRHSERIVSNIDAGPRHMCRDSARLHWFHRILAIVTSYGALHRGRLHKEGIEHVDATILGLHVM